MDWSLIHRERKIFSGKWLQDPVLTAPSPFFHGRFTVETAEFVTLGSGVYPRVSLSAVDGNSRVFVLFRMTRDAVQVCEVTSRKCGLSSKRCRGKVGWL